MAKTFKVTISVPVGNQFTEECNEVSTYTIDLPDNGNYIQAFVEQMNSIADGLDKEINDELLTGGSKKIIT